MVGETFNDSDAGATLHLTLANVSYLDVSYLSVGENELFDLTLLKKHWKKTQFDLDKHEFLLLREGS